MTLDDNVTVVEVNETVAEVDTTWLRQNDDYIRCARIGTIVLRHVLLGSYSRFSLGFGLLNWISRQLSRIASFSYVWYSGTKLHEAIYFDDSHLDASAWAVADKAEFA